mmetsp:Transcript_15588/g.15401  ORF Transcript_15588/g.15401 Transcript_15588/m.15401 type:complete len:262 (+) Transcript_15588:2-787(+)
MILGNGYKYGWRGLSRYNPTYLVAMKRTVTPVCGVVTPSVRSLMVNNTLSVKGNLDVYRLHSTPMAMLNKRQRLKIALKQQRKEKLMRMRGETVKGPNTNSEEEEHPPAEEVLEKIETEMKTHIDESIDIIIKLGIDPTKSQQQVRGTIVLPAGSGRDRKIAIFTTDQHSELAKESGADMFPTLEEISQITADNIEFETLLATKDAIKFLKPLGRTIGPLGLMPNLKSGTLVDPEELVSTVKVLKAGKIEVRNDHQAIIHA